MAGGGTRRHLARAYPRCTCCWAYLHTPVGTHTAEPADAVAAVDAAEVAAAAVAAAEM